MLKRFLLLCLVVASVSCTSEKSVPTPPEGLLPAENFERVIDGKQVKLYTLQAGDIFAQVTNFGARIVTLFVPDKDGNYVDVELGYENIDKYLEGDDYYGAPVGRFANRIGGGHFYIHGIEFNTTQNERGNTIHGGPHGINRVVWDVTSVTDSTIVLQYTIPDMHEGFPGNLAIKLEYSVNSDNQFKLHYTATTDKPTIVNLTNHSYFNLEGEGVSILDQYLTVDADGVLATDKKKIPTGEIVPIEGTPFDFRTPTLIGARINDKENEMIRIGGGYDHCWVLNRDFNDKEISKFISLYSPSNGIVMDVYTDQPGVQVYSANGGGKTIGKNGLPHGSRCAICLELQNFPDAINHDNFPSPILEPGEEYTMTGIFRFSTRQ